MNYRGFTGKRYKIKGMQRLGPILLTDKIPPSVTRSCDISIAHKQIHGVCEMTGSGQTNMILQTRLATTESFMVRLLFSATSKRHLGTL